MPDLDLDEIEKQMVQEFVLSAHSIWTTNVLVQMPVGSRPISVAFQGNRLCLWARVTHLTQTEPRRFLVSDTGSPIQVPPGYSLGPFVGTAQRVAPGGDVHLVLHVFELVSLPFPASPQDTLSRGKRFDSGTDAPTERQPVERGLRIRALARAQSRAVRACVNAGVGSHKSEVWSWCLAADAVSSREEWGPASRRLMAAFGNWCDGLGVTDAECLRLCDRLDSEIDRDEREEVEHG